MARCTARTASASPRARRSTSPTRCSPEPRAGHGRADAWRSRGNEFLNQASGLRLIGAGASQIQRSNIVDNSYGVFNAQLDGAAANNAVPIQAENNWWGLRANATTNPGPAIAPTTNPPVPENPVNSQAAVDFAVRAGPQSDPNSGEFPVFNVPGPVNDTAPTVGVSTDKATYHLGENVTLSAAVGDDFGVKNVVFYDGPWAVGSADRKPYSVDLQTADRHRLRAAHAYRGGRGLRRPDSVLVGADLDRRRRCATPTPTPTPTADPRHAAADGPAADGPVGRVRRPAAAAPDRRAPTSWSIPHAPAGLKQVDVFLGTTRICTLTTTPYNCRVRPTGGDVGIQELRAVISDLAGSTAADTVRVEVPRFEPRGLDVKIKSDGRKRTITAELKLPNRVSADEGCSNGTITLVTKRNGSSIDNSAAPAQGLLHRQEDSSTTRGTLTVDARFNGNRVLEPISSKTRRVS